VHETWELDIATAELDAIVKMLNNLGYFHCDRPGAAHLAVKMNGVEQAKDWEQIGALNLLAQRVRTSGRLVAYSRPGTAAGSPAATIASTVAYQQLLAARGAGGPAPPPVASAFALPPMSAGPAAPAYAGLAPQGGIATAAPAAPPSAGIAQQPRSNWVR
jgi:hypothetical protein